MNMCKALEELEEKGRIEGRREGEIKGEIKNKILLIQKKSQRGDSMEKIIDDLMESIEFVQPIYEMIKQNPEDRYILGQIHELKYILVSFFGLTEDELGEIQKDGFAVRDIEHPDKLI